MILEAGFTVKKSLRILILQSKEKDEHLVLSTCS